MDPLLGAGVDEAPQVRLQALVHPFRLAVRLRVVGGTHGELDLC
jgi:hypothetical protein